MFQNFRLSMAWLHTWFGLALGFVLMAAFFFGALSVFDREIDRWAIPQTRFAPQPMPSFDKVLRPVFDSMQPTPESVEALRTKTGLPMPERFETVQRLGAYTTHRDPVLGLFAERMADLTALIEAVAFQRLDQRLAAALLGHGSPIKTTHQALADELGTVREIVTRLLHRFERDGLIELSRECITICNSAALRAIASPPSR